MQKVGILGGGQLGRMLLQAAANYPVITYVLENDPHCPAAHLCHHFVQGDIRDYDTVYHFGKQVDTVTIEIESVNVDALERLEAEGVKVYPKPSALRIIKNKVQQKLFYKDKEIPTAPFVILENREALRAHLGELPAVQKIGEGGYDGRGVHILHGPEDLEQGFDAPSVLEKLIPIKKELSVIVATNGHGENAIYPATEMVFHPELNLLDYQLCPADIPRETLWKAEAMAMMVVKGLASPGIFAVELFVDARGDVWVNETAPRVHNSGHHTIEAAYSSQFDMLWRLMLGYPLGNPEIRQPSALLNVVGAEGFEGDARYEGLDDILKMANTFVHLYGKKTTKPGRKMGHITLIGKDRQELVYQAGVIKKLFRVIA
ncbi:5-(carboxyamino)imidazole ribonucleotide synthase [Dinghuibacter silviterrae]|uniref:N5-carboxyaminoimidazole ribonucleotide synthase n=1 Tax=Dinghuibacter silviterrae TaxID=1539049 RepID=A0A4R8DSA7_9BACT|nr:5-(carboxyamino)imidazole ribonucleotide synthase [Dinghuibacter silviterrae]TDX01090.1 5-(carboxyamino)imidazole ribonucleotide synthase [Dinghuibacter silviterrae]